MLEIFSNFSLSSAIDITLMSFVLYNVLLFVKGTRTQQILFGILILIGLSLITSYFELELHTMNWVIEKFYSSFIIVFVVLFQDDIRRMLSKVGKTQIFSNATDITETILDEIVEAAKIMAKQKVGVIIAIERENDLSKYVDVGRPIDAAITSDLMRSIFNPSAPLHDGAIIIQKGRISSASCFLPLTRNPYIDAKVGSRHRAAIGLAEETDAALIVCSEETGKISFVLDGKIKSNMAPTALKKELTRALYKRFAKGSANKKNVDSASAMANLEDGQAN